MKKLFILAALVVTGSVASFAQQTTQTANVAVNVNDVKTITINSGATPGFTLATTSDYAAVAGAGLAASGPTNLTVVSRGGYKVKAALSSDLVNAGASNGLGTIPGSKLGISVANPVVQTGETAPTTIVANTTFTDGGSTIADIIKTTTTGNAGGTLGTSFDVNYKLGGFPQVIDLATGAFIANVVYTIEAN
jgi:hypothetical protein